MSYRPTTSTYLPSQETINKIAYTEGDSVKQNKIDWLSDKSGKSQAFGQG